MLRGYCSTKGRNTQVTLFIIIYFKFIFKVKIQALNDSHQIGLCLYNVVILSAVGLTLSLLLADQEVMMYGITSGCLIIGTTLTQVVIFIPKVSSKCCVILISPYLSYSE
jgi:gamma-aminobutyric acid type B receptor